MGTGKRLAEKQEIKQDAEQARIAERVTKKVVCVRCKKEFDMLLDNNMCIVCSIY